MTKHLLKLYEEIFSFFGIVRKWGENSDFPKRLRFPEKFIIIILLFQIKLYRNLKVTVSMLLNSLLIKHFWGESS